MSAEGVSPRALWDLSAERTYEDLLMIEAPLQVWAHGAPYVVMMRTPGQDQELVAGLLWSSGVIDERADLVSLTPCQRDPLSRLDVTLEAGVQLSDHARRGYLTSSCGLCSLEEGGGLYDQPPRVSPMNIAPDLLLARLERLDQEMERFTQTGGCHGALLLDPKGEAAVCFEDVGRHNAIDKALGWALLNVNGLTPRGEGELWGLGGWSLLVSSRAGFEVVHKAASCGLSAVVCMGAASSLAHDYARSAGLTLFSFARASRAHRHSVEPVT